jgi:hypothetical protein
MSDDIGMQITKLLLRESPGLLGADIKANAQACLALSDVLGSLLATLKVKKGQAYYEQAAKVMFERIDAAAKDVHAKALHMAEHEPQSSH